MPRLAACSRIASTIIVSVCGVLKTHAFFALIGSMMRALEASEIVGVRLSATASVIASESGAVGERMIASPLSSSVSRRVLTTAALESLASSSTTYSTDLPAIVFGSSAIVFFSGMPSETAGPVVDSVTPILIWACAPAAASAIRDRASNLFIPRLLQSSVVIKMFSRARSPKQRARQRDVPTKAHAPRAQRRTGQPIVRKAREEAADRDAPFE